MSASQSVQVRETQVRKTPSFLGAIVATVHYGDRLPVLEDNESWIKVRAGETKGWLHSSALTTKEIVLNPNASDLSKASSSGEIALAGKGFNKEVEDNFRQNNKNVNFEMVDKMEASTVSQEAVESFLKSGGLKPAGGAV
jgi:uncharacterized protein YgiM (DUF1202 family)